MGFHQPDLGLKNKNYYDFMMKVYTIIDYLY